MAHVGQELAFDLVHFVQFQIHLRLFVDLFVQPFVGRAQRDLRVQQSTQHAIHGSSKFFEVVVGFQIGANIHSSVTDLVDHFSQMSQRFHDDVTNDQVQRDHRQERRHNRNGHQDGSRPIYRSFYFYVGQRDLGEYGRRAVVDFQLHLPACFVIQFLDLVVLGRSVFGEMTCQTSRFKFNR